MGLFAPSLPAPDGTLALPSVAFASEASLGFYRSAAGIVGLSGNLIVPIAPTATANRGLVSLGSGPFDGATAGFFAGSASGTVLAVNAASGFAGNLLDLQVAGSGRFFVSTTGAITLSGVSGGSLPTINFMFDGIRNGYLQSSNIGIYDFAAGSEGASLRIQTGTIPSILSIVPGRPLSIGTSSGEAFRLGDLQATASELSQFATAARTLAITGSYATQRFTLFAQPTITAASALTVTTAATVAIAGAPLTAGAGPAAITNPLAFWVQAGDVRFDNAVALGAGAAPTLGTIGGSGPATAAQNEWLRIRTQNGVRFIPVWA